MKDKQKNNEAIVITTPTITPETLEKVLLQGDLSKLTPAERVLYYKSVCDSLGLNPLTRPFDYMVLNQKLTLYPKRECKEQLRKIHKISIAITNREVVEGCYVVTARAKMPDGREDESIGAVPIESVKGENRSNAMMKAETKAKSRVTLSICGMGMTDETEIDSIPKARRIKVDQETGEILESASIEAALSPPPIQAEGATFPTFDPTRQRINAGKYGPHNGSEGFLWSELPGDYVQYLVKNAQTPEVRTKAAETIKWTAALRAQRKPEPNDLAKLDEPKPENESVPTFDIIVAELEDIARKRSTKALLEWEKTRHEEIGKFDEERLKNLRASFAAAINLAKEIEAKETGPAQAAAAASKTTPQVIS